MAVHEGERVEAGQLLLKVDLESVAKAGYDLTTPVIVTNPENYQSVRVAGKGTIEAGARLIELFQ